jgi:predicted amino acid racemase
MAKLRIYSDRIINNISKMNEYCQKYNKKWTFVTKVLGGYKPILEKILNPDVILGTHSIGDSRVSSLRTIKKINPKLVTMYLKPPSSSYIKSIVKYADISLNTEFSTIQKLNEEAKNQNKIHKIIIMIEMGELREGVVREKFLNFYSKVFNLSNIEVIGIGTNLGCMYGIEPTFDKLIQLSLYEQLIEIKFKRDLKLVSGGSSITLPLLGKGKVPEGVNHLRIGEAIFLGTSPLTNKKFSNLSTNAFEFDSTIVEFEKKEKIPDGVIGDGNVGHTNITTSSTESIMEYKAVLDFGVVDVDINNINPKNQGAQFVGTTSDLTVYSLGEKPKKYKTGKYMRFSPDYMAVARLMSSKFIEKEVL